jgi:uncharacterized protein YcfJ
MYKKIMKSLILVTVTASFIFAAGCQNDAQTGALVGSLAGAGIGQAIGRNTEGTLIGAAAGGGLGYILGNERDKQRTVEQMQVIRQDMNTETVYVTNSNGSIVAVKLQKYGVGYLGSRGEYYSKLPTSEQLRPVYGF